jgi:hypothetical protein
VTTQIIDSDRRPCQHSERYRNPQGYPVQPVWLPDSRRQRKFYEHRLVYEAAHGAIPDGWTIDHACHGWDPTCAGGPTCLHRRCIEVTHLELVTMRVNVLRGRGPTALNAVKTHCKRGHEFTPENTYRRRDSANGLRQCLTCIQAKNKARAKRVAK